MSRPDRYGKTLSLVGMIISGTLLGFYWQKMADSGQLHFSKIALTCFVSVGSYLIAFVVVAAFWRNRQSFPWIVSAIAGSVLSAFNIKVVKFLIQSSQDRYSPSLSEQLSQIGVGFLGSAVIYIIVAVTIVATIHLLGRHLERIFSS